MTDNDNLKLFEAIDAEALVASAGMAALARKKKKKDAQLGDDECIQKWDALQEETMKVKLVYAQARKLAGTSTSRDEKFFKSRLITEHLQRKEPYPQAIPQNRHATAATSAQG
jgi:hypothetical protein